MVDLERKRTLLLVPRSRRRTSSVVPSLQLTGFFVNNVETPPGVPTVVSDPRGNYTVVTDRTKSDNDLLITPGGTRITGRAFRQGFASRHELPKNTTWKNNRP